MVSTVPLRTRMEQKKIQLQHWVWSVLTELVGGIIMVKDYHDTFNNTHTHQPSLKSQTSGLVFSTAEKRNTSPKWVRYHEHTMQDNRFVFLSAPRPNGLPGLTSRPSFIFSAMHPI